ncbi:alpha/beta hydrolase [Formosa algae]|uniref:alpha/beta hydrolase n=1 Tax=Formosa algae TaxID=225843 RepID=UPI0011AEE014|nr:alpha/beta hydrolase [Formosa algae]
MRHNTHNLIILVLLCFSVFVHAQPASEAVASTWNGFEKTQFKFENREAFITHPKQPLPGNPWLWRARFPDYHTEIDSMLLAKGFHIAYVNTDNQFGSPKAVAVWNRFYKHVLSTYQLHPKVALHGLSRGGLFIYNWAKSNPEKVACIYGDAVVSDFKSWPGGFGESEGSTKDWETLKLEYGFKSDAEAKAYTNNPIEQLDGLVQAGVPIFHTISLSDQVVPPEENTLLLVNRYIGLGGTATVSPCNSGVQKSKGHHYQIDDPEVVVDFIVKQLKL